MALMTPMGTRRADPRQQGKQWGFNANYRNTPSPSGGVSLTAQPQFGGLMAQGAATSAPQAKRDQTQEYDFQPNKTANAQPNYAANTTTTGPVSLPPSSPTTTGNANNYGNTSPFSTPGNVPYITNSVPGTSGPVGQQRVDDQFNWLLEALNARNRLELGGTAGPGGNNINSDGSWNAPDWLNTGGLMSQYNTGANTDAVTRDVQGNETVEGRLAGLSRSGNELNRIAVEDAREGAAAAGMLGGSAAAEGAALRASRQAMLPVAQQDAAWYGQTAQANQDAVNRDRLSDQDLRSGLIGQNQQLMGQLYENASDRHWKSKEANHERLWNSFENQLSYLRQGTDREDQQDFAIGDREDQQEWNSWQNGLQRSFQESQAALDRAFQGDQAGLNRAHERQNQYFQQLFGREGTMASILAGIYSNPNLTPAQQQAAAANARQIMGDLWSSFNATLAQGVPEIFSGGQTGGGLPVSPQNPNPGGSGQTFTPPTRPPNGYQQQPDGTWPIPIVETRPDGTHVYPNQVGTTPEGIPIFVTPDGRPIQYP